MLLLLLVGCRNSCPITPRNHFWHKSDGFHLANAIAKKRFSRQRGCSGINILLFLSKLEEKEVSHAILLIPGEYQQSPRRCRDCTCRQCLEVGRSTRGCAGFVGISNTEVSSSNPMRALTWKLMCRRKTKVTFMFTIERAFWCRINTSVISQSIEYDAGRNGST